MILSRWVQGIRRELLEAREKMDWQIAFNIAMALVAFMGGWILNRITSSLDRLDRDVRNMPLQYVTRADFQRDIDELKSICRQIFDKLDDKADK